MCRLSLRTVVLQSYRTHDVPPWMAECMGSVRAWAQGQGWDYEFMDDRFFDLAPGWVKARCGNNLYAVTDLCRLLWLRDRLREGVERVVWADADLLVFAPEKLGLATGSGYGFAFELLLEPKPDGSMGTRGGANNALMVFERQQPVLDFYLFACEERLKHYGDGQVPRTALGPDLLVALSRVLPLPILHGVGLFDPLMMKEIRDGHGPRTSLFMAHSPRPLGAANLCHFARNAQEPGFRPLFDRVYGEAVDALLNSRGRVLDAFVAASSTLAGGPS